MGSNVFSFFSYPTMDHQRGTLSTNTLHECLDYFSSMSTTQSWKLLFLNHIPCTKFTSCQLSLLTTYYEHLFILGYTQTVLVQKTPMRLSRETGIGRLKTVHSPRKVLNRSASPATLN